MNYLIQYFTALDFIRANALLIQHIAPGHYDDHVVIPRERSFVFIKDKQYVCSSVEYKMDVMGGKINVILFDPIEVMEMHKNAKKTDAAKKRPKRKRRVSKTSGKNYPLDTEATTYRRGD